MLGSLVCEVGRIYLYFLIFSSKLPKGHCGIVYAYFKGQDRGDFWEIGAIPLAAREGILNSLLSSTN